MKWIVLGMWFASAAAAGASPPDQAALDDAVALGTVATMAPLCGMRDEAWAFDLRRAAIMDTVRSEPDDPALEQAPGTPLVTGALSFAESEALERFAAGPPAQTCEPFAHNPDLARADDMVRAFRALKAFIKPGS